MTKKLGVVRGREEKKTFGSKGSSSFLNYTIYFGDGTNLKFYGKYLKDIETGAWDYFERNDGGIVHIRKEKVFVLIGDKEPVGKNEKFIPYQIYMEGFSYPFIFQGLFLRRLEITRLDGFTNSEGVLIENGFHYYKRKDGVLYRFRKDKMLAVIGDTKNKILENRYVKKP